MSKLDWQKSSYSENAASCVYVATGDGSVHIRESDDPGVIVTTSPEPLRAFVLGVKAGEFDRVIG